MAFRFPEALRLTGFRPRGKAYSGSPLILQRRVGNAGARPRQISGASL